MKRTPLVLSTLFTPAILVLTVAHCDYGQYVADHSGLSCTYNRDGAPGVWYVCNLVPSLATPPADLAVYPSTPCGLLFCMEDDDAALQAATAEASKVIGRSDSALNCQRGTDSAYTTKAPEFPTCLDKTGDAPDAGEDCKKVGEVCEQVAEECCAPGVCGGDPSTPDSEYGKCCYDFGTACGFDSQCCGSSGSDGACHGGECECIPSGGACVSDICCSGNCENGKCCISDEEEPCVLDSDCCEGFTCGSLGFCNA